MRYSICFLDRILLKISKSYVSISTVIKEIFKDRKLMENYSLIMSKENKTFPFLILLQGDSSLFTNLLGSKIEEVLNQLNNGVQYARNNIGQFGNDLQTTKSSLNAIGESIYLTYFIALIGIGFGLLAIIIAVFSLSRRLPYRGILTTTVSFQIS